MSLFGNIFKEKEKTSSNFNWIALTNEQQLDEILDHSNKKRQVIFKHSTRCGISSMVLKQFENQFENMSHVDFYYLDLLQFRNISNAIALKFGVPHQSPQLIVVQNKKVVADASHHDILSVKLD